MTTQRLSLNSPSTPTRTSRFAVQDESHELDSFEHLASSQPISLSQLCARASSRLRTGKSSKRSHIENHDEDDTKGTSSITDSRDASETKSLSRLSKIHHANKTQSEAFEPSNEQDSDTWYNRGDIHPHRNPLSYSCGYDSPFTYSASGPYDAVSSSPFIKNTTSHNEFGTWPAARSYQRLLSASPANSRLNNILAESSFSIYRESFDRPKNQSPYESLHAQRASHNHPDIRDVAANMQTLSAEPHVERKMKRMTYLSSHHDVLREHSSDLDIGDQPSTPGSTPVTTSDQKHLHGKHSARGFEQTESPSPEDIRRRSVKDEVTAFLRAIVQNSHPNARQMEVQSLSQETKTSLSEQSSAENITEEMPSRGKYADTDNEVKHSPSNASWDSPENEDHTPVSVSKEDRVSFSQHGYLYEEIMEKMAKKAHESKPNKTVRPPPGIPDPVVQNTPMGPSYLGRNPIQVQERIGDAKYWFSNDNRGNQQLRQQVADIAENYAQRIDKFNGNGAFFDSVTAKQMTLLLGNVVINLHSYYSPDSHDLTKQDGCFANFGRVKSRYCEPNLGGRRSYFDQDPSTNQLRLSPERMLSSEDRPVSIGGFQEGGRA
ncbi:hypothetical protein ATEIFO6365_0005058300 [Aspergillus terreus]|uniref:Uncharacterized protein n=1 Tax=Aspergillus terreus TaxID=33178 RepID=A0A5M3Z2C4_ASPTE|nr:hypothetical protein ATETN484_0008008600 [Aspergillus terreus]GFF16393.1 hypothetical protein ATEIFO6365_0005058300 [Aspergillus terreus]